jgi:hypothetical protein
MPLPFDGTLKDIVQHQVQDFARVLHLGGPEPATVLGLIGVSGFFAHP